MVVAQTEADAPEERGHFRFRQGSAGELREGPALLPISSCGLISDKAGKTETALFGTERFICPLPGEANLPLHNFQPA